VPRAPSVDPLLAQLAPWIARHLQKGAGETARMRPFLRPAALDEGAILHREGEISREMFLVTRGLARVFYVHEHREVNLRLLSAPAAAIALASFIEGTPAKETIQTLTPVEGVWFRLRDYLDAFPDEGSERLRRVLAERHYLAMERRLRTLQWKSARERYAYFVAHMERDIVERVPLLHIASYLGVRPESLSRVRREATQKLRARDEPATRGSSHEKPVRPGPPRDPRRAR
jgi:CRP-like cAMP-binding protein